MKSEIAQKLVWANEQIKNGALDYNDDFCVLNDIGCGKLTEDSLEIIEKSKRNGYHAEINGNYEDPDRVSIILYMLYVKKSLLKITELQNFALLREIVNHFAYQ